MFEQKKSITVNGVTFNMILVEGDKFCIGDTEHEVDDFYMAEFPVTQELYMAVMGPAHTGSYNMMPDNFDYLKPNHSFSHIIFNESIDDYRKRLDKEWREQIKREEQERKRIEEMSKSLPVNNISWLECLEFINKLNSLTGMNFALPSFEQWYFAAMGGIESKGYAFAGSDDANSVGHFHKLSTITKSEGLFVMSNKSAKTKGRKAADQWFQKTGTYSPNELGLYDMSGLVYEWLDEAGKVIGGSYHDNPDNASRIKLYGYSSFDEDINSKYTTISGVKFEIPEIRCVIVDKQHYHVESGKLYGFRLILLDYKKHYSIPQPPTRRKNIDISRTEQFLIRQIYNIPDLGLLRSVVCDRFEKHYKWGSMYTYGNFRSNIYNVFLCPQNLNGFEAKCFADFHSRRKFVNHCKDKFIQLLECLCNSGYNLLIHDSIGLKLTDLGLFSSLQINLGGYNFRSKDAKIWAEILPKSNLVTNNPNIIDIGKREFPSLNPKREPMAIDYLKVKEDSILVEIVDTITVRKSENINDWIGSTYKLSNGKGLTRIILSCFCDFNSSENDTESSYYSDNFSTEGIVRFMRSKVSLNSFDRVNDEKFDCTELTNKLFLHKNKGGLYEYKYPSSSGTFLVQDEKFFILPQVVYDEWSHSLKK